MLPEAVPLPLNVLYHPIDAFAIHFELKNYVKPVLHSRVNHNAGRWRCSLRTSRMKENTSKTHPLHSLMIMVHKTGSNMFKPLWLSLDGKSREL